MTEPVDIVIVGGGIAGLSAGWALADRASVVVLEMEHQVATHATGRSAAVISETYGPAALCSLAAASRPFLEAPPEGFSPVPLARPRGLMWVSCESDALAPVAETGNRLDVTCLLLTGAQACERVPVLRPEWVAEAMLEPDAMSIDVAALVDGHRRGIQAAGGRIATANEALTLRRRPGGWEVRTGRETIRCDVVVNAAGAWGDEVARRADVDAVGLEPLLRTAFLFPVDDDPTGWPLVVDAGGSFYFEPEGDGLLASPADETPSPPHDARADPMAISMATDALAEATTLEVRGVRQKWAGLRTFAPDRAPVVGFDPDASGFFWLVGQGNGGIKTSPAMAALARALISGESRPEALAAVDLDPAELSPRRFR